MLHENQNFILNPALLIRFDGGRWQLHLPEHNKNFEASSETVELLTAISQTDEDAPISFKHYSRESLSVAISAMAESGVLIQKGSESPLVRAWHDWTPASWHLHLAAQNSKFASTNAEQNEIAENIAKTPPPNRYKCSCASAPIRLPEPSALEKISIGDALLQRRTCRLFDTTTGITLQNLADVLFYTGGVLFENETDFFGTVLKKCSPSPGARHSIEIYPVVNRCDGIDSGTYHYCTEHHSLNLVRTGNKEEFITRALQHQGHFTTGAVSCFFTSVTPRLRWKYKGPRIYKLAHFEAGHYCQNFLLAGTALDLGAFSTGALNEKLIAEELEIDGVDEIVLYMAGLGRMRHEAPYFTPGKLKIIRTPRNAHVRLPMDEASLKEC